MADNNNMFSPLFSSLNECSKVLFKSIKNVLNINTLDFKKLFEEIAKTSPISIDDNDFEKKLHESLYKDSNLIDWMQERGAIRYRDNYISKPNSWYDWIYVKGYRNEIIEKLTQDEWECENRCYIGEGETKKPIPYFWSGDKEIVLKKTVNHNGQNVLIKCNIGREEISVCYDNNIVTKNYLESVTHAVQLQGFIDSIQVMIKECIDSDDTTLE